MNREAAGPIACRSCDLNEVCRLCGLIALQAGASRQATGAFRTLEPGAALFRTGTPAHSIYAIRQGMIKTMRVTVEGDETVLGIHTPGEVLGLEGYGIGAYTCDTIALSRVVCCELPLPMLGEQSVRVRQLGEALLRLLSRAAAPRANPARGPVRQRVTAFLLDLAQRLSQRGLGGDRFSLGLSRQELADLLDTRIETVSRVMQQLHRERAIRVEGSSVTLLALMPTQG
jgi:CRP/FNR family transcriptional regulator, anaerobic regulatory protein